MDFGRIFLKHSPECKVLQIITADLNKIINITVLPVYMIQCAPYVKKKVRVKVNITLVGEYKKT
jgi:hypothetical protein